MKSRLAIVFFLILALLATVINLYAVYYHLFLGNLGLTLLHTAITLWMGFHVFLRILDLRNFK